MKKIKFVYNPNSGDKSFKESLDKCIEVIQRGGYECHIFRTLKYGDIENHFLEVQKDYYDAVVVSGGDGTVNIVINCMIKNNIDVPLGIIPSGTANDFASYINCSTDYIKCAEIIANGKTKKIDLGYVNGMYFVNVCAAGLFTNISQNIDKDFKYMLGKLAYYIDGIKQLPNFLPIPMKITNTTETISENINLFMILNTSGTGGFKSIVPTAEIDDGKLDFVGIKETSIKDIAKLLFKILKSEYLDDPSIIYFKDTYIKIELVGSTEELNPIYLNSDIDGEEGPMFPLKIKCINKKFEIFIP